MLRLRWYLLLGLVCLAVVFVAGSMIAAWVLTGPMQRSVGDFVPFLPTTTETIQFTSRDGLQLRGWFAAGKDSSTAVVLLHGHGSTRRQMLARAGLLHARGYSVLLYDARGHGESEGKLTSAGWYETQDLLGAVTWLRGKGYTSFGLIGASQGAATIALSGQQLADIKWIVLESLYPSMSKALDNRFRGRLHLPAWLAGAVFIRAVEWRLGLKMASITPQASIATFSCPVLIINGDKDQSTTTADTHELFDRAHEPKTMWIVPGAAHVDLYGFAKQDYESRLLDFIAFASKT